MLLEITDLNVGEMSSEESKYCLLDPKTRNVQDIFVDDTTQSQILLETFLGDKIEQRRKYLLEHIEETKDLEEY